VEPGPLLAEVRSLLEAYPRRGTGPIDWPETEELPDVIADRERFKQVLLSLCAASLRHSADGSLGLWLEREPLSLVFCLRMPSLDLRPAAALLAGKGFGSSGPQGQGAAGLGLLISRQLVTGMGGHLRLDADPDGRGGLVQVELALA
jgi:C4-dicarboxylate-specific signal transduction histidine kinase